MRYLKFLFPPILGLFIWLQTGTFVLADKVFDQWVRDFWPQAERAGISTEIYDKAFDGLTPDRSILKAADNQAEFVRAIWGYLDSAVSDWRIREGQKARRSVEKDLIAIERKWGVDRSVLVAIWGLESSYGQILTNKGIVKNVIRSLATLAYGDDERSAFGKTQLIAALKILQNGDTDANNLRGSWAGAMGHTQFIPTTYLAHAVDYDGDGKRNIWTSETDALASAANYLAESGWQKGHDWGYEVILPEAFDYELADGKKRKSLRGWRKLGVKRTTGNAFPRTRNKARLFLPAGAQGPAFLLLNNFDVIKRYNNADAYALAIGHLSDRLKGFDSFEGSWPRHLKPLTRSQKEELQERLTAIGFDTGGIDGRIGPKSRAAIRAFQKKNHLIPDGFATNDLLNRLRG